MSQALLSPVLSSAPSIILHNGKPATTSREVSRVFGKRHDSVLRDIRILSDNCPKEFHAHNFVEMFEAVEIGNGATRQDAGFAILRDGLTLLVMGYTGKKAMQFKLAYIEAFNAMEAKLAAPAESAHLLSASLPSTIEERKPLRALVGTWAKLANQPFDACWTQLKGAFQLSTIKDLPAAWVPDALAWVQAKIDALPKALPAAPMYNPPERIVAELVAVRTEVYDLTDTFMRDMERLGKKMRGAFDAPGRRSNVATALDSLVEKQASIFAKIGEQAFLAGGIATQAVNTALEALLLTPDALRR